MRRPSFQFYPADWRSNAKLRRCSRAERGDWIELMCLLHDGEEYGVLRWPLKDIAQAIGCQVSDLRRGLIAKGVLKGADVGETVEPFVFVPRHGGRDGTPVTLIDGQAGPLWYSSRMVRDEYVRTKRGIGTRFGDEPKPAPKPPFGDGPSSSSSSASSVKPLNPLSGADAPDDAGAVTPLPKAKAKRGVRAAAERVIAYLNSRAGTRFRVVEANIKLVRARILYDGATEEDLRAVVDLKLAEAVRGEFDRKYLRPATLWNAEKFAQYIGQVTARAPAATKRNEAVKVFAESEAGMLTPLTEFSAGTPPEIGARRALDEYGSAPWFRSTRNLVTRVNGVQTRFSLEELRQAH